VLIDTFTQVYESLVIYLSISIVCYSIILFHYNPGVNVVLYINLKRADMHSE